jgi:hypothetical protein
MSGGVLFYFRDPAALNEIPDVVKNDMYVESDPALIDKLAHLKSLIRQSSFPLLDGYSAEWDPNAYDWPTGGAGRLVGLDGFADAVTNDLWRALKSKRRLPTEPELPVTYFDREELDQTFIATSIVDRLSEHSPTLDRFASLPDRPIVVVGPTGSGKTSTVAKLAQQFEADPRRLVFSHFTVASGRSMSLRQMLWRLCNVLSRSLGVEMLTGHGLGDLLSTIQTLFAQVPSERTLVVLIDAVDDLEGASPLESLAWIPDDLAANVKVMLTCNGGCEALIKAIAERRFYRWDLPPLTVADRSALIKARFPLFRRALDSQTMELLLSHPAAGSPSFLDIAIPFVMSANNLDEARDRVMALPPCDAHGNGADAAIELVDLILAMIEHEFDVEIVQEVLSITATIRPFPTEVELNEIVGLHPKADEILPVLFRLRWLLPRNAAFIQSVHDAIVAAGKRRYLALTDRARNAHRLAAQYFAAQSDWLWPEGKDHYRVPHVRKFDQLPRQLANAEMRFELEQLLSDAHWVALKQDVLGPVAVEEDFALLEGNQAQ